MNNPLVYTDPGGEFWHIVIGAIVGSVVGNIQGIIDANKQGMKGWDAFKHVMVKAHIGGAAGALGEITGGAVGGGFGGAALGGATSGGFNAAATTAYNGGSLQDIMAANFWGSNIGGLAGAAGAGLAYGVNELGKSVAGSTSRIGNIKTGWLELSASKGFDYIPGDGIIAPGLLGSGAGGLSSMMINKVGTNEGYGKFDLYNSSDPIKDVINFMTMTYSEWNNHESGNFIGTKLSDHLVMRGPKNSTWRWASGQTGLLTFSSPNYMGINDISIAMAFDNKLLNHFDTFGHKSGGKIMQWYLSLNYPNGDGENRKVINEAIIIRLHGSNRERDFNRIINQIYGNHTLW